MVASGFAYVRAESIEQACRLLAEQGPRAHVLAGGQSLMPAIRAGLVQPVTLIDINRLEPLSGALYDGKQMRIGALTRHADLMLSHAVAKYLPLLAETMPHVAPVAVRNRGTFGGSIALSHTGAELPACLLALDGRIAVQSVRGRREVGASDFFAEPGKTALEPDELLIEAFVQPQPPAERSALVEITGNDGYAAAGIVLRAHVTKARLSDVRIVLFGARIKPVLAPSTMTALDGQFWDGPVRSALSTSLARDLSTAETQAGHLSDQLAALLVRTLDQICKQ